MKENFNIMEQVDSFLKEEDGMGVVEVVLIIIVLISLVIIFRKKIQDVVKKILGTVEKGAGEVKYN